MCVWYMYVCGQIHSYVRDSWGLGAARQTHLAQRTFVDKRHLTPVFGMKLESDSESEVEPESSPARRHCVRLWWTCWVRRRRDKLPKIKRCCRSKCRWLERGRGVWQGVRGKAPHDNDDDDDAGAHLRLCHIAACPSEIG